MAVVFRLLGEVDVLVDGHSVDTGHARQRCVLAALLVEVNRLVPVDQLIDRVWDDRPPHRARNALSAYVSRLRQCLAPDDGVRIDRKPGGYVLRADPLSVDLHRFRDLVVRARTTGHTQDVATLYGQALDLWHGEPFATLDTPWLDRIRTSLYVERLAIELDRNDAVLRAGRHADLLVELAAAVRSHPLDERLAGQLMLAQYRSGRQAAALDTYQEMRNRLLEELGADPGVELRRMHQQILVGDAAGPALDPEPPPARPSDQEPLDGQVVAGRASDVTVGAVSNRGLPVLRNELIGRDDDLLGVLTTVRTARATTISGPGGVGKTTLALAAGHRLHAGSADGAIFVDLTAARTADDVARTVSDAAGVQGHAARSIERLAEHLSARQILIILDNCEHVLGYAAEVVDLLLATGPEARVLATSREPLAVAGEHVWPLAPLDAAAPALFVERARAADPRIGWDPHDPEIVELCERLDGLPLAIELAAGQLRRWGFAELSRQLRGELSALARNARGSTSRHATMAAAIDWSYQLLDTSERRLLRHLSVFPSSFDLASVEAVAATLPDVVLPATLGELVDKSLVVLDPTSGRFRMLETIRVFAREHLTAEGEAEAGLESLRLHVVERARNATRLDRWLSARLAARWLADGDQARQAFRASLHLGRVADAVEIAIGAAFLWRNAVGCTEGRLWVDQLLGRELSPTDHVWALILLADLGQGIGDFAQMFAAASRAVEVDSGSDQAASCIAAHYAALGHLTDPTRGRDHLAHVRSSAPDARLANMIEALMIVPTIQDSEADETIRRLDRLDRAASDDGYDRFILNWVGWMLGLARRDAGVAQRWIGQQYAFLERTGIVETWLTSFSRAMSDSVDGSDVRERLARTLGLADREGYRAEADCALALAYSDACSGDALTAAELLGTAIRSRFNATAHYVLYRVVVEPVVRRQLEPAAFAEAVERGRHRTAAEALATRGVG